MGFAIGLAVANPISPWLDGNVKVFDLQPLEYLKDGSWSVEIVIN